MVCDAGSSRVDVGAAELLRRDVLSCRGLHERRAADEDRARPLNDHRLVRHRRDVCTAGRARAHDDGDLCDAERGESRLVEEDPAEVVAVGEDLRLQRQERPARVDEVDAGEAVLPRDLLCPQVLLHGERVVRAALHGRVVRDDDALAPLDDPDSGDDPGRRRITVVQLPRGERVQLQEGSPRVDESVDPLARGQLPARAMALDGLLAPAGRDQRGALAQLGDEPFHRRPTALERLVTCDLGREHPHRRERIDTWCQTRAAPAPEALRRRLSLSSMSAPRGRHDASGSAVERLPESQREDPLTPDGV